MASFNKKLEDAVGKGLRRRNRSVSSELVKEKQEALCLEVHLEAHNVELALWQESGRTWSSHSAAEGWEPLPFPADQASRPWGCGVSQHKKLLEWERGLQWRSITCQLAEKQNQAKPHPRAKGLARLVTSDQSIPK